MTEDGPLILLIEDEPQMRRFLRVSLHSQGYRLVEAETGNDGLSLAASRQPAVILLDLGLPDMDGLEVTEKLREWTATPIIVISAREQERDKVRALDSGADDYLTKPFGADELLARIRVSLRHVVREQSGREEPIFSSGQLRVDFSKRQVFLNDQDVHLTPIEYRLLSTLIRHADKVITHTQLLRDVWGPRQANQVQYLRVYMAQLRQKLEEDPARPSFLINEPGIGYRFKSE
ncbi:response regulator [Pelobacter seleniigenes]|uniref:response regulator n=1 Tax=Pelobacter seleniigenes TaxID=407188 RepID=UPI0004A754FF|nr:response regulator [Pelobacter seleniigenes]